MEHPTLAVERAKATFPEAAMRDALNGSRKESNLRALIMAELDELARKEAAGEPIELDEDVFIDSKGIMPNEDHTLEEARLQTMKMLRFQYATTSPPKIRRYCWASPARLQAYRPGYSRLTNDDDNSAAKRRARMELMSLFDPAWFTRNGVHFGLWLGAVQGQGDPAQVAEWMPPSLFMTLSGCFAMTEIGHGSFVRGIETTATYDPATQQFDVHTPRLEATKWWIGGAAKTATHAAVFAQLILPDGTMPGVHTFIVQLRSLEDHSVLEGRRVGDCGAKFGRNGLDNGWIQFNHVKIPREAMLSKYAAVTPDGGYVQRGRKQLQYGALIGGRAIMVTDSAIWLKAAVTIAVRFLALRRQGDPMSADGLEPQLLDFRTVQTRVMPLVATAYALNFTALYMQALAPQAGLTDGDETENPGGLTEEEYAAALPDLHATCAGLKAFATWSTYNGLDTLRQCLGGHGYSAYTSIGRMFTDFAVQCTWEGDNTVMALQTARYLVASFERLDNGEQLSGSVAYLNALPRINKAKRTWAVKNEKALRQGKLQSLLDAFRYLLAKKVERVSLRYRAEKKKAVWGLKESKSKSSSKRNGGGGGGSSRAIAPEDVDAAERAAWNTLTPELLDCSRAHCYYVISENFVNAVNNLDAKDRKLLPALSTMCRLYILSSLSNWLDWFLAMEYMNRKQMFLVKEGVSMLCSEAREIAVPCVDAFGLTDLILRSPLGRRDGDVYNAYFDRVLQKPGVEDIAKDYADQIGPMLKANL